MRAFEALTSSTGAAKEAGEPRAWIWYGCTWCFVEPPPVVSLSCAWLDLQVRSLSQVPLCQVTFFGMTGVRLLCRRCKNVKAEHAVRCATVSKKDRTLRALSDALDSCIPPRYRLRVIDRGKKPISLLWRALHCPPQQALHTPSERPRIEHGDDPRPGSAGIFDLDSAQRPMACSPGRRAVGPAKLSR